MRSPRETGTTPLPEGTGLFLSEEPTQAGPDFDASPLERAVGRPAVRRYEDALLRLRPRDRQIVRGRIELQQSYGTIAEALGLATAAGARAAAIRALGRLVEAMSA
ncbi:MAG TPA: hypothetical protein VL691_15120 [Vicinamibacteria bacterium]|nr:hypothetical protein [Vicinamibacteria bacterium]